jgi:hypothetical protein
MIGCQLVDSSDCVLLFGVRPLPVFSLASIAYRKPCECEVQTYFLLRALHVSFAVPR